MKKIITAILAIALALPTAAQSYYGRTTRTNLSHSYGVDDHSVYYGLRLGLGLTTVNSDNTYLDGGSLQAGLNLGAVIGFQLSSEYSVYLESGLMYMEKGGKGNYYDSSSTSTLRSKKKFTYSLNYLELPILVKYVYDIDDDLSIQPFAGGYLAVGIGGKMKNYADRESSSSFSNEYFQRFDGGLRIGCGIQYQVLYAELGYEFGLANIARDEFESAHNSALMINLGVNF